MIEEASTGTLFLDEMGEMPIDLQAKLLRVLETNEFIKVGDTKSTKVNVRIIAATNRNLEQDVKDGAVQGRSVLPHQCFYHCIAGAAGKKKRHFAAGQPFSQNILPKGQCPD